MIWLYSCDYGTGQPLGWHNYTVSIGGGVACQNCGKQEDSYAKGYADGVSALGDLKSLREALCVAEIGMNATTSSRIQRVIGLIDELRPLGPDGKHGNRHTPYCGCDR